VAGRRPRRTLARLPIATRELATLSIKRRFLHLIPSAELANVQSAGCLPPQCLAPEPLFDWIAPWTVPTHRTALECEELISIASG
jgi:hypothetical protein